MAGLNISSNSLASCMSSSSDKASNTRACPNLSRTPFDRCPSCKVQFDFLRKSTKLPLILNCKHTVCEDCIRKMCCANKGICPICAERFAVPRSKIESLNEFFELNFTIIGYLAWARSTSNKKEFKWVYTGQTLKEKFGGTPDYTDVTNDLNDEVDQKNGETYIFVKCLEHTDQFNNIQCDECEETYCCYCFIENHTGHKATYLYKLNEAEMEELEKYKADAEVILSQLLASRKQAKQLKGFDASDVEQDIRSYFVDLHAKLHLAERNIRKKLSTMQLTEVDVDGVNATLISTIKRVTKLLDACNALNDKQVNMRVLLEEARSLKNTPCRLISNQGQMQPIEFLYDNVFDDIEDNVCMKNLPSIKYSLIPIEDWSRAEEKCAMNQLRRHAEMQDKPEPQNLASAVKTFKQAERKAKKVVQGTTRIVVTHINDLNSFFIQKFSTLESLKEMNNMIGRRSRKKHDHEEFKLGGIYGVHYETKNSNQWRRGKLVDISMNEDDVNQYKIFFIDYGNTQIVTRDKLREIDSYTIKRQNFAQECKLAELEDVEIESNIHLQLPQIVGQKELYVRYLDPPGVRRTVHEVEVLVAASNGGFVSIRDLLVRTQSSPKSKFFLLASETKLFNNSTKFYIGQDEQVIVTYIKDPFYICVQLIRNVSLVEKMKFAMEEYYKTAPVLDSIPVIDSDVIAEYDDDEQGMYHRAKIMSVHVSRREVEVLFVDWGKDVVLPWSSLKLLTQDFIKLECQGIIVKLADLDKPDATKPWSQQATEFLRDQVTENKTWRMAVHKVEGLEVALFRATPSADFCLNSLLVEQNLALSTGSTTKTVFWPRMTNTNTQEDEDFCFQLIKKSEAIIIADDDNSALTTVKWKVKIIDFKSPDLIYVKFLKFKDAAAELLKELQIHYKSSQNKTKNSWKPNQKCVVLDKDQNYYRAVINKAQKNDTYMVFLTDIGKETTVHKKEIFIQERYFEQFPAHVAKCRLSKIKPAGDGNKWSQLAIEMLQKMFTMYKDFHVAKLEMSTQEILGVTMWYSFTSAAKALEPAKVKFISINQSFLESGVALVDYSTVGPAKPEITPEQSQVQRPSWNDLINEAEENATTDVIEISSEESDSTCHDSWPVSLKVEHREFDANLICIITDGHFLVRDDNLQLLYQQVEDALKAAFNSPSVMHDSSNFNWEVNDMCTINYEGVWYRGTILAVLSPTEYRVEMIDYGSDHIVYKDDLSRGIMFPDCPPLVYKIQLYDVQSTNGAWTREDLDELLSIVSDKVRISIKGDLNLDIPFAEIYLDNGLSVNDLFARRCPHIIRTENKIVLESVLDEDKDIDELNDSQDATSDKYNYVGFPQISHTRQKMTVVNVLNFDNGYSVVLRNNENNNSKNFARLCETIHKAGPSLPALKHIQINAPCVCLHSEKNKWSRALIYSVNSLQFGFVLVFFVDYGTVEMMPVSKLKELRSEWLDYPVYLHSACLNIELVIKHTELVLTQLSSLRGTQVWVNVVSEEPLKVDLYGEENLIYQDLIDSGIIRLA